MSKLGFILEEIIHAYVKSISPKIIAIREHEIRKLTDNSMNGVDHWFIYQGKHVFIQDKWTESNVGQQEMAQFVNCVSRIVKKENIQKYNLCLATKSKPSTNALKLLIDSGAKIIQADNQSILASRCSIEVSNYFSLPLGHYDPLPVGHYIELLETIKKKLTPEENKIFISSISDYPPLFDMYSFTSKLDLRK